MDKTALKIVNLTDEKNDFAYWQSQPYATRLAALEAIRTEYNTWKYDSKQGFQRVYRVTHFPSPPAPLPEGEGRKPLGYRRTPLALWERGRG